MGNGQVDDTNVNCHQVQDVAIVGGIMAIAHQPAQRMILQASKQASERETVQASKQARNRASEKTVHGQAYMVQ
jgi:hypothetical protein